MGVIVLGLAEDLCLPFLSAASELAELDAVAVTLSSPAQGGGIADASY